jgi:hypothetical protein
MRCYQRQRNFSPSHSRYSWEAAGPENQRWSLLNPTAGFVDNDGHLMTFASSLASVR